MSKKILDAAGLFKINLISGDVFYTTYNVLNEVKSSFEMEIVNSYLRSGKLKVFEINKEEIENERKTLKSSERLSDADISVILLAKKLDDDSIVYTDDYELQNTLSVLGIKFEGVKVSKIKERRIWVYMCTSCGRYYKTKIEMCPVCGGMVKRRLKKTYSI